MTPAVTEGEIQQDREPCVLPFNSQVIRRKDTSALFPDSPPPPPSLVLVSLLCVLYGRTSPSLMIKIEFPTWAALCIMCVSVSVPCTLPAVRKTVIQMGACQAFWCCAPLLNVKNKHLNARRVLRRDKGCHFHSRLLSLTRFCRTTELWQPDAHLLRLTGASCGRPGTSLRYISFKPLLLPVLKWQISCCWEWFRLCSGWNEYFCESKQISVRIYSFEIVAQQWLLAGVVEPDYPAQGLSFARWAELQLNDCRRDVEQHVPSRWPLHACA